MNPLRWLRRRRARVEVARKLAALVAGEVRRYEADGVQLEPVHSPSAADLLAIARARTLHEALSPFVPWDRGQA